MLIFPTEVFDGAKSGLLLCFFTVLPTLLPLMIGANLLLQSQTAEWIGQLVGPVFKRFFQVSSYGAFVIVVRFICGYPMGGKVIGDLRKADLITFDEASYLFAFCNNPSPGFIISYIILGQLEKAALIVPSLQILFLTPNFTKLFLSEEAKAP